MMPRRLVVGWVCTSVVLFAVALMMLLAGLLTRTTSYPHTVNLRGADTVQLQKLLDQAAPPVTLVDRTAALTFDGGPSPQATQPILELLRRERVPATFFVTGSDAVQHPKVLREIVRSGHELGNGGFTYSNLAATSGWRQNLEINTTQAAIINATGTATTLARPFGADPGTAGNQPQQGRGALSSYLIVPTGPTPTRWGTSSIDELTSAVRPVGDGGVILSYPATSAHLEQTLKALPTIIDALRSKGYRFTTVSAAIGRPSHAAMHPVSTAVTIQASIAVHALRTSAAFVAALRWVLLVLGSVAMLRIVALTVLALVQARAERRGLATHDEFRGPVSILVPAYNEEVNIAGTLTSLLRSRYPDFEIIVINDGSTDQTAAILATFADRVTVLHQPNRGKAVALNNGIRHARHDIVAMVDSDSVYEPDTLAALVAPMSNPRVGAVAGNTKVANRRGLLGTWQHLEFVMGMNLDRRMFQLLDCMPTVPGVVGAFRRQALTEVGGVPTRTLAEDTDLTMAVNLAGWQVVYADKAIAWTEAPATTTSLARQRFRWCYGTLQAMWAHRRSVRRVRGSGSGHIGSRGIPYLIVFQVAQPLLSPIIDVYLIYALLFLSTPTVLLIVVSPVVLQLITAWIALRLDHESARPLWAVPLAQIFYRQLLYLVVLQSLASAISGTRLRWHQPPRTGAPAAQITTKAIFET